MRTTTLAVAALFAATGLSNAAENQATNNRLQKPNSEVTTDGLQKQTKRPTTTGLATKSRSQPTTNNLQQPPEPDAKK
jgi:hypothetical protein